MIPVPIIMAGKVLLVATEAAIMKIVVDFGIEAIKKGKIAYAAGKRAGRKEAEKEMEEDIIDVFDVFVKGAES